MRSQVEIAEQFRKRVEQDFLGFEVNDYLIRLDYKHAKEFLKETVTAEQWNDQTARVANQTDEGLRNEMREYMEFAFEKANGCRGLSANRSLCHYYAWAWLLGDDALVNALENSEYCYYGKPQLVTIAERLGVDWKKLDDGHWVNSEYEGGLSAEMAMGRWREEHSELLAIL